MNTLRRYDLAEPQDNTTATIANTDSINRENAARQNVNKALDGFGAVLGSIIKGAPQQLAPILAATPGMAKFAKMMGFAEGYVDVWRNLTTRGVNFSNELDTMITSVGGANLQMQDFQKIVGEQSIALLGLGGTMNRGAVSFLKMQTNFEELGGEFEPLRKNLNSLGMGSVAIAERFAESDALDAIRNIKEGRTEGQRNRRATEYAKTLDTLSRLTGKQADALAAEMADISRKGNIFAFGQGISEEANVSLTEGMTELSQFGGIVSDMATDLITRGFINADDPNVLALNSASPELRNALLGARDALRNGEDEVADQYFQQASAIAADLKNNQQILRMAALGGVTDITRGSQEVLSQILTSGLTASQQAIASGNLLTVDDELITSRKQLIRDELAAQLAASSDGAKLLESQQEAVRQLQDAAKTLQETAVTNITKIAEASMSKLSNVMSGTPGLIADELKKQIDTFTIGGTNILTGLTDLSGPSGQLARQVKTTTGLINSLALQYSANGDDEAAQRLYESANSLFELRRNYTNDPSNTNQLALQLALENAQTTITANKDIFVNGNIVNFGAGITDGIKDVFGGAINIIREQLGMDPIALNTGTMGETGSLFKNFGSETIAALHGLEAVVTPEQMHAIVRNSALGAMEASSTVFGQQTARNNSGVLDGMLNTIRTMPTQMAQMQPNADSNELKSTMTQLGTELKSSLVSALNSTLVPSVDKLVTISAQNADTSDKIRRGIGNMSNDMLRSV